jgi:HD-GYP domain-containing protein (c-di-GMP phosphodiesterase class II)
MIKKVSIAQLKPGMYIHDLNCGWMEQPSAPVQFKITSPDQIKTIAEHGLHEVYIDTEKGLDVADAQTVQEVNEQLDAELVEIATAIPEFTARLAVGEEMGEARKAHRAANKIITGLMQDIRLGRRIETEQAVRVVEQMTNSIFRNKDAMLSLTRLRSKDAYTFQHSVGVCALMVSFASIREINRDTIQAIGLGALLCDIGKMKVPEAVLNKPGNLTADEFKIVKSHVVHSRILLEDTLGMTQLGIDVAAQHHERFDGSGYPLGLKHDGISLYGQMAAIVDVYDAITADRCYQKGMETPVALRKLLEWSKLHFDERLVHSFVRTVGIYPVGTLVKLESGQLGVVIEQHEKNLLTPRIRVMYDSKRNNLISPRDIDLSKPVGKGGGDRILGYEEPKKWNIDPLKYL